MSSGIDITAETIRQALACGQPGCACGNPKGHVHCPGHEDVTPSLSVSNGGGKILVKCFGGCPQDRVIGALKEKKLWPSSNGNGTQAHKPRIVATYDYHDSASKIGFQVCRMDPKSFRQCRPDGAGGRIWGLTAGEYGRRASQKDWYKVKAGQSYAETKNFPACNPVPYRLPEVRQAEVVAIVEGEKDADALTALGVTATCNPGGAGKWRREFHQFFRGKKIVILPDNDEPGRAHAQDVAQNLHGAAAVVKVVELAGLPEKGDVSDWIKTGGTFEQLADLVKAAPEWEPRQKPAQTPKEVQEQQPTIGYSDFGLTDQGNAHRFKEQWGEVVRWCDPWAKFLHWDERRWTADKIRKVDLLAIETIKRMYAEASQIKDKDERKAMADHAKRSEADNKRKAMLSSVKCLLPVLPEELDRDPYLINVMNGTIDLRTGELRPPSPGDFITKLAPVHFDEKAKCPLWWSFLSSILPGPTIEFLQKAIGYSATGLTMEQVFFLLYGGGDNGKTTFLEIIFGILGDYAKETDPETFMAKKSSGIPNDLAALRGARFVKSVETSGGRRMSEVRIKQMTGGDTLTARFLHAEWFEFRPEFKLWLATNHKPVIKDSTHSMWRRIRLIPFEVQISKEQQDKQLTEKLRTEFPGILNWIIEGALLWQHEGLEPPGSIQDATQNYRDEMDELADFLSECCTLAPDARATVKELFNAYQDWAEAAGEKKPMSKKSLGLALGERGFQNGRTGSMRFWQGIGIRGGNDA